MTKKPSFQAGFILAAMVVIAFRAHHEFYSNQRYTYRSGLLGYLRETLFSARPYSEQLSYNGEGVQLLLINNKTEMFMFTTEGPKHVNYFIQREKPDGEKITEEQNLHLNYLETEDKIRAIKQPIDDPNSSVQTDEISPASSSLEEASPSMQHRALPLISEEQLVQLAFFEIEERKRAIRLTTKESTSFTQDSPRRQGGSFHNSDI